LFGVSFPRWNGVENTVLRRNRKVGMACYIEGKKKETNKKQRRKKINKEISKQKQV
jgi:hypothetical protein